jgi:serine/threonine protein kinase
MSQSHYILGQVIARGGMAEVYRGLHVGQDGFKRIVAIKRILPQFSNHKEFADMFRDEAHIGQRLQHVNVVKVECYDVIEGLPSIVMEFVDGSDLRSILAEIEKSNDIRRFPMPMVLHVIAEAARGLHYAHTRRDDVTGRPLEIVHRDISPQNILVSFNGEIKVTDFGIAAADSDFKNTETRAGIVKGKYSYMSPEQISAKKVDGRTDIYALAIVMWEMLAMRRLFSSDNEVEVIEMVKNCKIPGRLRDFNKEVHEELELICMRALAKDPSKRFSTAEDFERALRGHLSKHHPSFSVTDLGQLIKHLLANRHEASQAEIKKMLTSTNLKAAPRSTPYALELDSSQFKGSHDLHISKTPSGPATRNSYQSAVKSQPSQQSYRSSYPALPTGQISAIGSRQKRSANDRPLKVMVAALAVVVLGFLGMKIQSTNAAKDALSVTLRTSPTNVKIRVNGQYIQGGRYVTTPTRFKLDLGPNIVEISRNGYQTESLTLDTQRNEHRQNLPVVRMNPRANFSLVRLMLAGNASVRVSINDGFVLSQLSPSKPVFEVRDIIEGSSLDLLITEKGQDAFKCRAVIGKSFDRKPIILTIDVDNKSCQIRTPKDPVRGAP